MSYTPELVDIVIRELVNRVYYLLVATMNEAGRITSNFARFRLLVL